MTSVLTWLDEYERRARLIPGLLTLLPAIVVFVAAGLRDIPAYTTLGSLVVGFGLPVVLAGLVGERGRKLQVGLWSKWGAPPTTVLLRMGGGAADAKRDWRRSQVEAATETTLPIAADETANLATADERYDVAVTALRNLTYDKGKFPLVFAENKNYGFVRNVLAMRPLAIAVSSAGLIALVALIGGKVLLGIGPQLPDLLIGIVFMILIMAFWIWFPTEERVRDTGFRYAERLVDSATTVAKAST